MNLKKRWVIPALGAALLTVGGTALASVGADGCGGHRYHHSGHHGGHHGYGAMSALMHLKGITDQQRTELRKVFDEARDTRYAKMKEWRTDRRALHDAMRKGAAPEVIKPLAQKRGEQVAEMIMLRAETRAKVDAILTDAQRQQLEKMKSLRHGHGERRG